MNFVRREDAARAIVNDVMGKLLRFSLCTSVVLACLCSSACTRYEIALHDDAPAKVFDALPANAGQICVVRPHNVALLVPAVVRDNRRLVGMTKGPTWFCWLAEPGLHKIMTRYGDDIDENLGTDEISDAAIMVDAGGRYYLQHDVSKILTLSVRWVLDTAEAQAMISECQWADMVAAPSGEKIPSRDEVIPAAH